jgi:nucleoside-diphosphate-sugar epimerase
LSRIAVTGGAGFLGSHISSRLIEMGHEVSIIDDLSAGSLRNLRDLGVKQRIVKGDLKGYEFAKESLRRAEVVYHFAAEVGSVDYLHGTKGRELAAMQANIVIDANVLRACVENGVGCVIYASSVSVYPFDRQQGQHVKFREEDAESGTNPEGGYGWSKYLAEKQLAYMPGVPSGVARIFHAYGKNIYIAPDRSQVIASLLRKAIRYPQEGFVVWGDGRQRRCFVYIDDVLDALFRLQKHVERKGSLTVNIGSTEEVTVLELARRIIALSGKNIKMEFDRTKPSGALNRMPNLERVRKALGWRPTTSFSKGLATTYQWARSKV